MKKGNKKVKRKSRINKKIIINIIITIVLVYCFCVVYKLVKEPTDTFVVEYGKLYLEENATGYILREETVVKGENYKNGIVQIKLEGEKVAKGESVFRYYSNGEDNLTKKIQELDIKINEALSKESDLFSSDIKIIDNHISKTMQDLYQLNDMQTIKEYKKEINTYVTKKAQIAGSQSPSGSYINKLIEERNSYAIQLNTGAEYINAVSPGVVSYRVDGLEEILKTNDFSYLTSEFLESLKLKTGQIVSSSDECGKVINNFKCYVVAVLDSEEANKIEVGNTKAKLRLSNSKEISAKVVHVVKEADNKVLVVFEIHNEVEELISYRRISLDIIWWGEEGLKIPNSAIIEENGKKYIMRNRAGYIDKIIIKILKQNENYAIVDNYESSELTELGYSTEEIKNRKTITLYDEIIAKPTIENQ